MSSELMTQFPLQLTVPEAGKLEWLYNIRAKHKDAFLANGLPTRKNERWKYSDLSILSNVQFQLSTSENEHSAVVADMKKHLPDALLVVFVDGMFAAHYSDLDQLPEEVTLCSMHDALEKCEDLVKHYFQSDIDSKDYPFASLNCATFTDGMFLHVHDNEKVDKTIHVVTIASGEGTIANLQHLIVLGDNSHASIASEYVSVGDGKQFVNVVTSINAGANANLKLVKLQHGNNQSIHMENFFVKQMEDSNVDITNISTGSHFARDDIKVTLDAANANCRTAGFYHTKNTNQYVDNHIDVDHVAANTSSEMMYKGIADGKSRAVFNGRLHVLKDAQKINAMQANHNLLLSNLAEVYSKPELEIYADDVKCKHGATTGQIDQDALFYMRARGISEHEAISILLRGFAEEVLDLIECPQVQARAKQLVEVS